MSKSVAVALVLIMLSLDGWDALLHMDQLSQAASSGEGEVSAQDGTGFPPCDPQEHCGHVH